MLIHWIWLATRPNVNDYERAQLLQHFSDAEDIYFADEAMLAAVDGIREESVKSLCGKELAQAREILDDCTDKDIRILTFRDAAYPSRLKNISDPPVVLYYKGKLPDFENVPWIGVVGTRDATAYGLTIAKRMGYQLAKGGAIVVSGMAFGIDGMAMRGALTAGASVVGILGCGADVIYPLSNRALFADTEVYGCLISEFPPGTPPAKWNFPRRNRIISGLCCGVLVVEAPKRSGALITARQAADQGRDVFVVPGNIDVASCEGSNALLRDGAIAVSSGNDILAEYEAMFPGKIHPVTAESTQIAYPDEVLAVQEHAKKSAAKVAQKAGMPRNNPDKIQPEIKKPIDNGDQPTYIDHDKPLPRLTPNEEIIVSQLQSGEQLADEIIAATELSTGAVLAALTMLEVKGVIARLPGKRVKLKV